MKEPSDEVMEFLGVSLVDLARLQRWQPGGWVASPGGSSGWEGKSPNFLPALTPSNEPRKESDPVSCREK